MSESIYEHLTNDERRVIEIMKKSSQLSPGEIESIIKPVIGTYPPDSDRKQLVINALVSYVGKKQGPQVANHTLARVSAIFSDKSEIIIEEEDSVLKRLEEQAKPGEQTKHLPSLEEQVMEKLGHMLPSERYEMIKLLGSGGMGAVYLVQDKLFGSPVAKKMPNSNELSLNIKFVREARIARKLDHPNFVPVHEFGIDDELNKLYMTMKAVNGCTLDDLIDVKRKPGPKDKAYSLNDFLRIMAQVCHGVGYMHKKKNLIHLDLKPANIMVGEFGEVYVMDVGGARDVRETDEEVVYTPSYVAPEQVQGKSDTRSDVYSLGVILYNIATKRPFRVFPPGAFETEEGPNLIIAKNGVVGFPGFDGTKVPKSLQSIIMKAANGNLKERYQSVDELREDIQAFLDDKLVKAHSYSFLERSGRWGRRNIGKILGGLAVVGVLATGSVGYTWLAGRARAAERETERQAIIARENELKAVKAAGEKDKAEAALSATLKQQLEKVQKRAKSSAHIKQAMKYLERGQVEEAVAKADDAIRADETDSEAYFTRGLSKSIRRDKTTIEDFIKADELHIAEKKMHDSWALYHAAMYVIDVRDKPSEAVVFSRRALEGTPDKNEPITYLHMSNVAFAEERYKDAIDLAEQALALDKKLAEAMYRLSNYYGNGIPSPYNKKGFALFKNHKLSLELAEKAYQIEPKNFRYLLQTARVNSVVGTAIRTHELADKVLEIESGAAEAYYFKARAFLQQREFQNGINAIASLERLIKPDHYHLTMKGILQYNNGMPGDAYDSFTAAIQMRPTQDKYVHRGEALISLKRYDDAVADCTEALRIDANEGSAYLIRGKAYSRMGKLNDSINDFDKAGELNIPRGHLYGGKIALQMGNDKEAAQRFQSYLKTNATEEREQIEKWLKNYKEQ